MSAAATFIKVCGLTREADVDAAVAAGVDAVGFNLWPGSARHVTLARAGELAARLPDTVRPVLLFVNASTPVVEQALQALPRAWVQFHGDEAPADCAVVNRPYWRAVQVEAQLDLRAFAHAFSGASALVLDSPSVQRGGSGTRFDWTLIPRDLPLPVVLSGGLDADNVGAAIAQVRPWAVDVSSGVEGASKGIKDAARMARFCAAVRAADRVRNSSQ